jgi:hypothetical protein
LIITTHNKERFINIKDIRDKMGIGKIAGIVMLPLGILIIMEYAGIFAIGIGFNKIFVGSIIMILLQLYNIIMAKVHNGHINIMSLIIFAVITIPALAYIFSNLVPIPSAIQQIIPLIIRIMMVLESIYTLH